MEKIVISTNKAPAPGGKYSQAIRFGNMVFVAGTCPFDLKTGKVLEPGNMTKQTEIVLRYIEAILEEAGTSLEHVVKVNAYIDNLDDFKLYDEAYASFFKEKPPVRSTVEIGKFHNGMKVEIDCIAYIP